MTTKTKKSVLALAVAALNAQAFAAADGSTTNLYSLPVLPVGPQTQPVDGRPLLTHDNAAIAASYNAKGRKAALDVGHLTEWTSDAPAVGWIRELYVETDGSLWARCEMTADGQALIDGKKFGYTSPTLRLIDDGTGWTALSLKSLALTNNPALEMSANFTAETDDQDEDEVSPTVTPAAVEIAADSQAVADTQAPAAEASAEPAQAAETSLAAAPTAEAFAAAQDAVASLTAERDAARTEVTTLTTQLAALTAERDAARSELAAFNANAVACSIQAAIDQANVAGRAYPFEREMLTTYGAAQGLDKLNEYLSARPAATPGASTAAAPTDDVPADVQAYLARHGLPIEAYIRGQG